MKIITLFPVLRVEIFDLNQEIIVLKIHVGGQAPTGRLGSSPQTSQISLCNRLIRIDKPVRHAPVNAVKSPLRTASTKRLHGAVGVAYWVFGLVVYKNKSGLNGS
jgi:hypothetical protein